MSGQALAMGFWDRSEIRILQMLLCGIGSALKTCIGPMDRVCQISPPFRRVRRND